MSETLVGIMEKVIETRQNLTRLEDLDESSGDVNIDKVWFPDLGTNPTSSVLVLPN